MKCPHCRETIERIDYTLLSQFAQKLDNPLDERHPTAISRSQILLCPKCETILGTTIYSGT